jgi:hypothetical protein
VRAEDFVTASTDFRDTAGAPRDHPAVRTTLEIDDDLLKAMKKIAAEQKTTVGRVLSDLARQAITSGEGQRVRNGVPLLPRRPKGSPPLTMDMVNRLRDED